VKCRLYKCRSIFILIIVFFMLQNSLQACGDKIEYTWILHIEEMQYRN